MFTFYIVFLSFRVNVSEESDSSVRRSEMISSRNVFPFGCVSSCKSFILCSFFCESLHSLTFISRFVFQFSVTSSDHALSSVCYGYFPL